MAGSGDDPMGPVCYSELLFGDDVPGLDTDACTFGFSAASFSDAGGGDNSNAPKMLCFGDYADGNLEPDRKSGPKPKPEPTPKKKRSDASRVGKPGTDSGAPGGNRRSGKKQKGGKCTGGGNGKVVKKEKLGERITALQQLVSPFGKTDTASVLHEALGYIRFLQDQVQVLCSPYLHPSTSSAHRPPLPEEGLTKQGKGVDLRSRGLCLVPVELTVHVTETNGADLWTSAAMLDSVCTI